MQLEITVLNWEKYNSKNFQNRYPYWFKLHKDILWSKSLFKLSPEEKWVFICLLALVAHEKQNPIKISIDWLSHQIMMKTQVIEVAIKNLTAANILAIDSQKTGHIEPGSWPLEEKREDKSIAQFDIDALYELYPRKIGKKKGLAVCKRVIKNETDYDKVRLAIGNYSAWLKKEKTEKQFIKHFSTFMNSWEDWIDITPEFKPQLPVIVHDL